MTGIVHALVNFRRVPRSSPTVEGRDRTRGVAVRSLHILGEPTTRIVDILGYTVDEHGVMWVTAITDNAYDFGPDQIKVDARRLVIA